MSGKHYVDAGGRFLGTVVDGPSPAQDAIEVESAPTDGADQWDGGDWVRDLAPARVKAARQVAEAAETARLQFITPGSGKAMAYQEKAREAMAFLADAAPTEVKYPLIYAEAGITAATAQGVAELVAARFETFRQIEAQIARTETGAKRDIAQAPSAAEIDAILAGLAWPKP